MLILTSLSDFHVYTLVGFVTVTSLVKKKIAKYSWSNIFSEIIPKCHSTYMAKIQIKKKRIYWRNSIRMKNDRTALGLWGRSQLHDTTV